MIRKNNNMNKMMLVLLVVLVWYLTVQFAYRRGQQEQQQQRSTLFGFNQQQQLAQTDSADVAQKMIRHEHSSNHQQQQQHNQWEELWWATNFKGTLLQLDDQGMIVFPPAIRRLWIDVGVHAKSEFMNQLEQQLDLFLIGFEPALTVYQPCPPKERCVIVWAACVSSSSSSSSSTNSLDNGNDQHISGDHGSDGAHMVDLYMQRFGGMCNSLLRSTNQRGCVRPKLDSQGRPLTTHVPGIPLYSLLSRIPSHITVEFMKVDAQGYDLQVMKGAMFAPSSMSTNQQHQPKPQPAHPLPQIVSLEAMDVTNKSLLLYHEQPTLDEMIAYMQEHGWNYVTKTNNTALIKEVNAYFCRNASLAYKVNSILQLDSKQ